MYTYIYIYTFKYIHLKKLYINMNIELYIIYIRCNYIYSNYQIPTTVVGDETNSRSVEVHPSLISTKRQLPHRGERGKLEPIGFGEIW